MLILLNLPGMRILIIDSEPVVAEQLKGYISAVKKECSFLPLAASLQESLQIVTSMTPDVIFMDVDLSYNKAFNLFRKTTFQSPIIFTASNEQHLNGTVENNGITYIMKPFEPNMIEEAFQYIEKSRKLSSLPYWDNNTAQAIYKSRFLVKQGQKLIPVKTSSINHFSSEGSLVYLVTHDKRKYVIDEPLNELDTLLNPADFFRVNRKFIISKEAILSLDYYSKGQVAVRANLLETERIIVSRQQTPILKMWLSH